MEKQEIEQTRIGGLGSSDAKMVARIGRTGIISDAAKKRIAIMLGIDEQIQFSTAATDKGNQIEDLMFEEMQALNKAIVSNPYHKNIELSEHLGFDVFNHIDMELLTSGGTATAWECKATKDTINETEKKYIEQLQWHILIGESKFPSYILYLLHYNTNDEGNFDLSNAEQKRIFPDKTIQSEILTGLQIISEAIKDFKYEKKEELMAYDLPDSIQLQLEAITAKMQAIQAYQDEVDAFKDTMLTLMQNNGVKSIKNDFFNLTVVSESVSIGFDKDKLKKDLPEVYEKYNTKRTNKKSYLKVTIK